MRRAFVSLLAAVALMAAPGASAYADGATLVLQKNPIVNLSSFAEPHPQREVLPVPLPAIAMTLEGLLGRALAAVWPARLWDYDPARANCQDFVLDVLGASRLLTPALTRFVKQPLDRVLAPPINRAAATLVTDLAARADVLRQGNCGHIPCL